MKKKIRPILRASVSILLIMLLLYIMRGKYGEIAGVLRSANPSIFMLAFLFFTIASFVASFRMKILIEAQGIKILYREALSLTFIGYFFNNFLPTSIGGDVIKAHYLSKHSNITAGSYTAVFVDRVVGLLTMIFMAFAALLYVGTGFVDKGVAIAIFAITGVSVLAVLFFANKSFAKSFSSLIFLVKPIEKQLRNLYNMADIYRNKVSLMLSAFAISIVSQLSYFACYGILALSINSRIPAQDLLLRMPIVSIITLLPSINGLGVREGSTVVFFGGLIGKEHALAISILMIVVLLITSLIGGIVYAVSPQFKMKLKEIKIEGEAL